MHQRFTPPPWLRVRTIARQAVRFGWCAVAALAAISAPAAAATLRVAWDPSPDPAVVGYRVSMGTESGVYTVVVDAGTQTIEQFANLTAGNTYYFVVQAYDRAGRVSPPSNEVAGIAPLSAPLAIVCPVPTAASNGGPLAVSFSATTSGGVAPVTTTCTPASGSLFPIGSTPVVCTASDAAGALAACDTAVVVMGVRTPDPTQPPCPGCRTPE
jgi:hypothetical protein